MKGKFAIALAVIVLAMVTLACSVSTPKAPEAVATVKAVATEVKNAVSTATPTPVKPGTAPTTAPGASGDQSLSLSDRQAGLDKLKSYRMKWQAAWKSTEVTSTQTVGWNWIEEYSSNPKALHWTWVITDSLKKNQDVNMEWWQIGDTTYMLIKDASGKGQCTSFSSDDQKNQLTKGLFNPSALGNVSNAKYVGAETVNNLKTKHYKYDEKGLTLFGAAKSAGDIWVATDGEFVVKEIVSWSGVAGLFGLGSTSKGDGKWTWELTDVNATITIKAPENCGGAATGLPIMKDATDKSSFGDMISYKTPSKLADVVAFYKKEMVAAGWKLEGEPMVSDQFAQLQFTKAGQQAQVILSVEGGKTSVLINVGK